MFMRYLPKLEKKLQKLKHVKELSKTEESPKSDGSKVEYCEEDICIVIL